MTKEKEEKLLNAIDTIGSFMLVMGVVLALIFLR